MKSGFAPRNVRKAGNFFAGSDDVFDVVGGVVRKT